MKKSFEYIIKISETEFYDKLKKHTAFNCSSSSYDNGYEFYCDNPKNITDLKVTSTSLLSREGILAPLIKIQTKQLDENLKVNLTLQSNKIYYFLDVLFFLHFRPHHRNNVFYQLQNIVFQNLFRIYN